VADTEIRPGIQGVSTLPTRSSHRLIFAELLLLVGAAVVAIATADTATWDGPLFATLLVLAVVSELSAVRAHDSFKISGSFLALVLAMVFLGGPPAAALGVVTMCAGWVRWRQSAADLLTNVVAYATFPLAGGLVFHWAVTATGVAQTDAGFYLLVLSAFIIALAVNVLVVGAHSAHDEGVPLPRMAYRMVAPVWPSEVAAALLAAGVSYLYVTVGLVAIPLIGIVMLTFQHLLGQLLLSQQRADRLAEQGAQIQARTRQLASLQIGVLTALLRTLDLRDRMTARHCAAVARYSREIAIAMELSEEEQDLVHTAGLLHDIGKFIFPDSILKGGSKLSDEDWQIVKMHPFQGARIVASVDGYGPVSEIIWAHHERIDGEGYPRRLKGEEIPLLSRIISVADTYDVMTARDSYREPVSSFEAIQELQRVSGAQLDGRIVDIFVEILAGRDVRFRHGEDADFDAELNLNKRIADYSQPVPPGQNGIQPRAAEPVS
jgi:putative nucleotidyltransferase with HDIG domain